MATPVNRDDLTPGTQHKTLAIEVVLRHIVAQIEAENPARAIALAEAVSADFDKISADDEEEAEFIEHMKAAAALILLRDIP